MTDIPQDVTRDGNESEAVDSDAIDISPSVRRLLRQYDLDPRAIRGSGPDGRIRPGDVLAAVGNPQQVPNPDVRPDLERDGLPAGAGSDDDADSADPDADRPLLAMRPHTAAPGATTIFVCNMSRVLTHRTRAGLSHVSTASYVAQAAAAAARRSGLIARDAPQLPLAVVLDDASGARALAVAADDDPAEIQARLESAPPVAPKPHDAATGPAARTGRAETALGAARRLVIHHRNTPGNLLDLHEPAGHDELATLGVGGLQRTIALTVVDGNEAPRIVVQSHLSFSYRPGEIDAGVATRFAAECVRILEAWPVPATRTAAGDGEIGASADGAPEAPASSDAAIEPANGPDSIPATGPDAGIEPAADMIDAATEPAPDPGDPVVEAATGPAA